MNKWIFVAPIVALGLLATVDARAENKGAKLVGFIALSTPEACGVSIEVTDSVGGYTDGTEKLKLGAEYSWTFTQGGFSPPLGQFGVGKHVLYGSPAFAAELKGAVDISIPDAACKSFNESGGALQYDGSLNKNPNLINVAIPVAFGLKRAFDGTLKSVDLATTLFLIYSYAGQFEVGTASSSTSSSGMGTSTSSSGATSSSSGSASSSSGATSSSSGTAPAPAAGDDGCSVSKMPASTSGLFATIPAIGLVLAAVRRRRRNS